MNHPQQVNEALAHFVLNFPATDVHPVGELFLDYADQKVPVTLADFYRDYGLGWYGDQEIEFIDPGTWMPVLQTWLGAQVQSVPIAVTSFGHLYHVDANGQVQCLDPHFLTNTVVAPTVEEFFARHLPSEDSHLSDLRGPHQGAVAKLGSLASGELYHFEPALPLGGVVSPDSLAKGDGVQQLLRVHQLVRAHRNEK